jgi:hypothetical protein
MAPDLNIAGYLIPAYAISGSVALWVALWTHTSRRRLSELESRLRSQEAGVTSALRRQEEAFRLLHSPRVQTAVALWERFCAFEYAATMWAEAQASSEGIEPQHAHDSLSACLNTWDELEKIYRQAEVLLPVEVFGLFTSLFDLFQSAFALTQKGRTSTGDTQRELYAISVQSALAEAESKRPIVAAALRKLISGET